MSLARQVWLMLCAALLFALLGSTALHTWMARQMLQSQLQLRNEDGAATLAIALSQQRGDPVGLELVISAQFDSGHFQRIELLALDGHVLLKRERAAAPAQAPGWFVALLAVSTGPGEAPVSAGWQPLGRVQVWSQADGALDALWAAWLRTAAGFVLLGLAAAALSSVAVRAWRRPIDAVVAQAQALEDQRFLQAREPSVPELRQLTRSMNSMVSRLQALFDEQVRHLETLRLQSQTDAVTGLLQRQVFVARLDAALRAEGQRGSGLVLVRLRRLQAMNRRLGHAGTDRLLAALGQVLQSYPQGVQGSLVGRLNGADLALYLPAPDMAAESAASLRDALRAALAMVDPQADLSLGAAELRPPADAAAALAQADRALAQAELSGPFAVSALAPMAAAEGEGVWQTQLLAALVGQHWQLQAQPVRSADGELLHQVCTLQLQLQAGGAFEPPARWLPLAVRCRLSAQTDLAALSLALQAIGDDACPRSIAFAAASLAAEGFIEAVRAHLQAAPERAALLWLELGEDAAQHAERVQRAVTAWRLPGLRIGLVHGSARLRQLPALQVLGIDHAVFDGALLQGVGTQPAQRELAEGLCALLHGMQWQVLALGVDDPADRSALWGVGFDGVAG